MRNTRYLFVFLFLILGILAINAQHWNELSQESIHLKYEVPQGWYLGGYKSDKTCQCTGAYLNSSCDQSLTMLIFFSDKESIDSLEQQKVWGYNFSPSISETKKIYTDNFEFDKTISTWKEDKEITVWRFTTSYNNFSYLIYFWGDLASISKNEPLIDHILNSIQSL